MKIPFPLPISLFNLLFAVCLFCFFATPLSAQTKYFPSAGNDWQKHTPEQAKMDAAKLQEAIDFAVTSEAKAPRDMDLALAQTFGREPYGEIIGPTNRAGQ